MLTEISITPISTIIPGDGDGDGDADAAAAADTGVKPTISATPTTSVTNVSKVPKHVFTYIKMRTDNVNHTALYKGAENTGLLKETAFKALFYHKPSSRGSKDLTSREHDEVISNCVPALGFKCSFVEVRTKKESTRYAIIYDRVDNTEDAIKASTRKLNDFALHYRRTKEDYPIYCVCKLTEIK
jgi:hypothetical protein